MLGIESSVLYRRVLTLCGVALASISLFGCNGDGVSSSSSSLFTGSMSGSQVVPPVTSPSSATFTARLSADETFLDISITHDVLDLTAIDLRGPAPAGSNGPVIFDILANGTITREESATRGPKQVLIEARFLVTNDMFLEDLGVDLNFIQIDSLTNPTGELRGQLRRNDPNTSVPSVSVTNANLTFIESLALGQVNLNAAQIVLTNNSATDTVEATSHLDLSMIPFVFSGNGVTVSPADPMTGLSELLTLIPPLQTRRIVTTPTIAPTSSQDDPINLHVATTTNLGQIIEVPTLIRSAHRGSQRLDYITMGLDTLGGSPLVNRGIPGLSSIPFLGRLLSTGDDLRRARNESLLIFVTPTILRDSERGGGRGVDAFPCGPITNGLVICPEDQGTILGGDRLVLAMGLDAAIPLNDPVNSFQYGFVFDSDGDPNNNFVPDPAFPEDFFQGTDRWYFITYSPGAGWQLFVVDATAPGTVRVFNDARVIILGNTIMLVAPQSEFGVDDPSFRISAFRHTGDFGANGDFDVSYHPGLDEPLATYPMP